MDSRRGVDVATILPPASEERFRAGTLTYTRAGLIALFFWLLWGEFCFTLMGFIKPYVLPIQLKSLGATNQAIALFGVTIPNLLSLFIAPIINVRSDRYRSRWGRRIPFLILATPFVSLFLIL